MTVVADQRLPLGRIGGHLVSLGAPAWSGVHSQMLLTTVGLKNFLSRSNGPQSAVSPAQPGMIGGRAFEADLYAISALDPHLRARAQLCEREEGMRRSEGSTLSKRCGRTDGPAMGARNQGRLWGQKRLRDGARGTTEAAREREMKIAPTGATT